MEHQINGQEQHPHVQTVPFTPFQQNNIVSALLDDPSPIPINIDDSPAATTAATMPSFEELQALAAAQSTQLQQANEMLQRQQQAMVDAQAQYDAQQQQLRDSAEQMRQQQQTINQLSSAFQTLTTTTASAPSRKKPEMPAFDQQNILVWLRRLQAAYDRAGVTQAKDKFAYLESTFDITFNPIINDFLFNSANTNEDWDNFVAYMKLEYGPTRRQRARKLIGELPRNSMKPSQYLSQLEEEVKDVTIDDVKKEHLLKTIPPRIREIMGKAVESKTAKEVAAMADHYFDSQGRPLEKSATSISSINNPQPTATASHSSAFTAAFEEEESDINFVKKGNFKAQGARQRSQSRPRFNNSSKNNSNSNSTSSSTAAPRQQHGNNSLCRFHRMFGDQATKCVSDCPRHSSFIAQQNKKQPQGNAHGGRRL